MSRQELLHQLNQVGLVAVLRGPSMDAALRTAEALIEAGLEAVEITFSTPDAPQVVQRLRERHGARVLLGMGTLTRPEHAEQAASAGAGFLVSPHLDEELAQAMASTGLATMMGAFTPTEAVRSLRLGSDVVKLFPGSLGGPSYLKALRGPLPDVPFMPTGGVSQDNVADWFAAGAFAVGAGSQLCPSQWVKEGRFTEISKRAEEFLEAVRLGRTGG